MAAGKNSKKNTKSTKSGKAKAIAKSSSKAATASSSASKKKPAESKPAVKSPLDSPEFQPIVRDLIRLAKEQDYLTYDDINEALPDTQSDLELMEELIERLRAMKFRIIDGAEVDNVKAGAVDDDDDSSSDAAAVSPGMDSIVQVRS